jgi:hypothetical protein
MLRDKTVWAGCDQSVCNQPSRAEMSGNWRNDARFCAL